jgi:outer membrane protein
MSFSFLSFSQGETKEKWTLKKCIEHANSNSITALSGGLNVANNEINYKQSKLNLLPTLNGSGSHNYNFGRTVDPITNSYVSQQIQSNSFGLNAGLNVFSGFQARSNVSSQRFNYLASQKELEVTLNSVALSISNFYLQIIQSREIVKVAQEQLRSSRLQLENTKKLIEAGSRPGGDLYSIEAQVANDELGAQNAENTLELALLNLKNILNLGVDAYFDVGNPKDVFLNNAGIDTSGNIKDVYSANVDTRPEVQAAAYRRDATNFMLKGAKGGLSPRITLFGNINTRYSENGVTFTNPQINRFQIGEVDGTGEKVYGLNTSFDREKTPFGDQLKDNLGRSVGLSMSIPLFNGFTTQNNVKLAKLNLEQANLQVKEQENKYLADLTQASTNYKSSIRKLESSKKNRDAQELNYNYSEKRFEAGAIDFMTFSLAKNNFNIAEAQYIQAKYEYVFTGLVLNFYKGIPIEIE